MNEAPNLNDALVQLKSYQATTKLKDAIQFYLATHIISAQDIKVLRESFTSMDQNGDGKLSRAELTMIYNEIMTNEEAQQTVEKIMDQVDSDKNGVIEYSEFLRACVDHTKLTSREHLETVFRIFDSDASGKISMIELQKVLRDFIDSQAELEHIINEVDRNSDGEIDFKEFVQLMTRI